jgi:hypothetical protein
MTISVTLSPDQRDLARHALGLSGRHRQSWRNHFITGPGSPDYDRWREMEAMGAATRRAGTELTAGDDLFRLTRAGATAALDAGETLDPKTFPIRLATLLPDDAG